MYCIYRITNCINGKTYIGKHEYKDTPYDKYMGSGKDLKPDQRKYGKENFIKGIIIDGIEDKETAKQLEKDYIALERVMVGVENCYNKSISGQGGNLGEEVNRKISEALKGKPKSEELRKHWSEVRKNKGTGKNNPMYGRHHSEETRKHWAEIRKGKGSDLKWCNNGVICRRLPIECIPEGWSLGRIIRGEI